MESKLGQVLLEPENDLWKRFFAPSFGCAIGTMKINVSSSYPGGAMLWASGNNNSLTFKCRCKAVRILCRTGSTDYINPAYAVGEAVSGNLTLKGLSSTQVNSLSTTYATVIIESTESEEMQDIEFKYIGSRFNIVAIDLLGTEDEKPKFYLQLYGSLENLSDIQGYSYNYKPDSFARQGIYNNFTFTDASNNATNVEYSKYDDRIVGDRHFIYITNNRRFTFTISKGHFKLFCHSKSGESQSYFIGIRYLTSRKIYAHSEYDKKYTLSFSQSSTSTMSYVCYFDSELYMDGATGPIQVTVYNTSSNAIRIERVLTTDPLIDYDMQDLWNPNIISFNQNNLSSAGANGVCLETRFLGDTMYIPFTARAIRLCCRVVETYGRTVDIYMDGKLIGSFNSSGVSGSGTYVQYPLLEFFFEGVEYHEFTIIQTNPLASGYGFYITEIDLIDGKIGWKDKSPFQLFIEGTGCKFEGTFEGFSSNQSIRGTGYWVSKQYLDKNNPREKILKFKGTDLYLYCYASTTTGILIVELDGVPYSFNTVKPDTGPDRTMLMAELHNLEDTEHTAKFYMGGTQNVGLCGYQFNKDGYALTLQGYSAFVPDNGWKRYSSMFNMITDTKDYTYTVDRPFGYVYLKDDYKTSFYTNSNVIRIIGDYEGSLQEFCVEVYVDDEYYTEFKFNYLSMCRHNLLAEVVLSKEGVKLITLKRSKKSAYSGGFYVHAIDVPQGFFVSNNTLGVSPRFAYKQTVVRDDYNCCAYRPLSKDKTSVGDFVNIMTEALNYSIWTPSMNTTQMGHGTPYNCYEADLSRTRYGFIFEISNKRGIESDAIYIPTANNLKFVSDVEISLDGNTYVPYEQNVHISQYFVYPVPKHLGVKGIRFVNFFSTTPSDPFTIMITLATLCVSQPAPKVTITNSCIHESHPTVSVIKVDDERIKSIRLNKTKNINISSGEILTLKLSDLEYGTNFLEFLDSYGAPVVTSSIQVYNGNDFLVKIPTSCVTGMCDSRCVYTGTGALSPDYTKQTEAYIDVTLYTLGKNAIQNVYSSSEDNLKVLYSLDNGNTWLNTVDELVGLSSYESIMLRIYFTKPSSCFYVQFAEPVSVFSDELTLLTTETGFKKVLNKETKEYKLTVNDGIGIDDADVDYNLYTAPGNIKLRALKMGVLVGGQQSKIFAFEVINGYDYAYNLLLTVERDGVPAVAEGYTAYLQDFEERNGQTKVEMSLSKENFSPIYPLKFKLEAMETKIVYIRIVPQSLSPQENVFQVRALASPV